MRCCALEVEWVIPTRTEIRADETPEQASTANLYREYSDARSLIVKTLEQFPDAFQAVSEVFARVNFPSSDKEQS